MPILNYTTKIDFHKTIGEITRVLVANGARKIMIDYDDDMLPSAVTFSIQLNNNDVVFKLPARHSGVLNSLIRQKVAKQYQNKEQSVRIAWRIIKDWVEAQMAIVQAEMAEVSEVFLPYAITQSGNTIFEDIKNNKVIKLDR